MPAMPELMKGINIYFSYAQKDKALRDELDKQLSMLRRLDLITSWHDYQVVPGEERASEIDKHLKQAHVILLLVSPDFIASDHCYSTEMKLALERHDTGEANVIPIIMRPTAQWKDAPFGKLQALPANGKPISTWKNREIAFVEIADGIRNAIEKLLNMAHDLHSTHRSLIALPPTTHPETILQREKVVEEVYNRLTQSDTTALVLTGIGGVGKSTLAALVYRYAEGQRRAGNGPFTAEALWLKVDPAVTMADLAGTLFEALGKPSPDVSSLTPQNLSVILFNALNTTDKPRLVVLDQFEDLLNLQTGHALMDRSGVGEWLDALNNQSCTCRVLFTSRLRPRGTREYPPSYMQEHVVSGLEMTEGIALLRSWGINATEAELHAVVEHCQGHALALVLLASLLRRNRSLSITVLFNHPIYAQLWRGDMAQNLLDYIYTQQLDQVQRHLLLAFSVYREAVPLDAAQTIVNAHARVPERQLLSALDALLAHHLLQALGDVRYQLHPIVASYARDHFVEGDEHANAAQYYQQRAGTSCLPRKLRRRISDVHDLIEALWHRCQAEQWQEAYTLMLQEGIFFDLQRWGGNSILLELYRLLLPLDKWQPERSQAARIYNDLGEIYNMLGQKEEARKNYAKALDIFREMEEREGEVDALNNLGLVCRALGQKELGLTYYREAWRICEEIEDFAGKGITFNNLGKAFRDSGQKEQALKYYEQALPIYRKMKYPGEEARTLNNIGEMYYDLGQKEEALKYFLQALNLFQEMADRWGEANTLNNLGVLSKKIEKKEEAQEYYEQALRIFREIGDRWAEGTTLRNLGILYLAQRRNEVGVACFLLARDAFVAIQHPSHSEIPRWVTSLLRKRVGQQSFETLLAKVEPRALQIVEQALREEV